MYSKRNQFRVSNIKSSNDFSDINDKRINSSFSMRNINNKNNIKIIFTEEDKKIDNSINNDLFKGFYYSKKKKNNFMTYYSKKKFKSINLNGNKPQLSNYIIHSQPFYSDINMQNNIKKNVTYTIKNPQKEKSKNKKNKSNEDEVTKNSINKEEYEDDYNEYSNSIRTNFLSYTENNNRKTNINGKRRNINLSQYQDNNFNNKKQKNTDRNDILQRSSSNASRCISFIMDYSKDEDRENIYIGSPMINMNKFTLNSSINRNAKSPFYSPRYDESINIKKEKVKTPSKNICKIRRQIELSKIKFEKMLEIEKNIKNYFLVNGVSLKNRELYHQSAIIIQSTFRAYLSRSNLYKKLNIFVGIRILFDWLNKILSSRKIIYYEYFFKILKKCNEGKTFYNLRKNKNFYMLNKAMFLKKQNIPKINHNYKKQKDSSLKIELSCYLNIISKKKATDDINISTNFNQDLILINKKISKEKKYLEEEVNKLRLENEYLKKNINDRYIYKLKENQKNNFNSLTNYKTIQNNINKNSKNIENVSLELNEIKRRKKNIGALNIPVLNLKKNKNLKDGILIIQNNKHNDMLYFKKYRNLFLKYLLIKKILKVKDYKIKMLHKYLTKIKNIKNINEIEEKREKDELINRYKFKHIIENINYKLRKYICICFLEMVYKYLYLKASNPNPSYTLKSKINSLIIQDKEKINNEKRLKLKNLINYKIKEQKYFVHKAFIVFYYQGLLNNNNFNKSNSIISIINTNKKINSRNKINSNNNNNKFCYNINNNEIILFKGNDLKIKKLEKLINTNIRKNNEQLKFIFYKFYYKGVISTLYKNAIKQKENFNNNNNIYIKKGYESRKNFNKNNE